MMVEHLDKLVEMVVTRMAKELQSYFVAKGAELGWHPGLEKVIEVAEFRELFWKGKEAAEYTAAMAAIKENTQ